MKNLHKAYYKDYFKDIDFNYLLLEEDIKNEQNDDIKKELKRELEVIEKDNKTKIKSKNNTLSSTELLSLIINPISPQEHRFSLKIAYPGLVTGVGINHEAKIEGEFKLGVHFDYTWGMPVVYGSSVKGVLKAYFTEFHKRESDEFDEFDLLHDIFYGETRNIALEKKFHKNKYQKECQEKCKKEFGEEWEDRWESIWAERYENNWESRWKEEVKDNDKKRKYISKSIYNRDIFFDAVITVADSDGRILCSDSITPHGDNPLKNPVPLTFMKIAAGCTMEFRFKLVDTVDENGNVIFYKNDKVKLFEEILKTVGVGAKTNVGYGQFQQIKTKK